jgi:competence protein ComEC
MRIRVFILFLLVLIRMGPLWVKSFTVTEGDFLRVSGKAIKVYQKSSVCEIVVGNFVYEKEGWCDLNSGVKVEIIGRVRQSLLIKMLGQIFIDGRLNVYSNSLDETLFYRLKNCFEELQAHFDSLYAKFLPEPEASLVAGIVLGSGDLPYQFRQDLIETGLIHIVVASGFNVMIVGMVIMELSFYIFRRGGATVVAIVTMFLYSLLAGFDPPVVRAFIMGSLVLLGLSLGRGTSSLWSLGVACLLMILMDPSIILSISFQLSIAASFGLIAIPPKIEGLMERFFDNEWLMGLLKVGFVPTISAQIMTLPLIFYYFGRIAWWGFLSNVFVLPVIPVLMMIGVVFLGLVMIYNPLGYFLSWVLYSLAHFVVVITYLFV